MGPSALRIAGVGERIARLGHPLIDRGDLATPIPETEEQHDERKKYIHAITTVCTELYDTALESLTRGAIPLVLGGDHSLGAGSAAAAAAWATNTTGVAIGRV